MSPDAAFRESLFDALADDEGADYWQSVYGQPIHEYSRPSTENKQGELEQMTDEEYAAYVRARMWEKTHQAASEERERRRRERENAAEEAKRRRKYGQADGERDAFDRMVNESLQRGKDRRDRRKDAERWNDVWRRYLDTWDKLDKQAKVASSSKDQDRSSPDRQSLRNLIMWPVESGKRKDLTTNAVEKFMRHAPFSSSTNTSTEGKEPPVSMLAVLKTERVRWHPDKIQHRYASLGIEDQVMKSVTEVFQIIDRIWGEEQDRQANI